MARTFFVILVFLLWSCVAHGEKRVALVIGNGAYDKVDKLRNPVSDARAVAGMLRAAHFDEVVLYENLGFRELRKAIKDFSNLARDADTAVVYYSGHGIEVNGINYLVPTDAVLDSDIDAPYEAYSLDNLVQVLEPARRLRLVMLDACRENPFARSMRRTLASRAVGGGLAPVEPASVNTLIGFAAKAGSIALDGEGPNSPYTLALVNHIATPGLDLRIAFGRVRDEVLKVTRNKQEPFVYGSLGGSEIALVPTNMPATPPKPAVDYDKEMEITFWNAVKDAKSQGLLQTYLDRYPNGNFAGLAKFLIEQLDKEQNATRVAVERDTQAQLAEAARVAAEVKQAEELRKADALRRKEEEERTEELKRAEAEARAEAQRAQDAVREAEADRLAALKAAEEARGEADAARAEQQRLATFSSEAEAPRQSATVVAALPPGVEASKQAADDEVKLARALQTELKRVGCDPGAIDGIWGTSAKDALAQFARYAKVELRIDVPTEDALRQLSLRRVPVCLQPRLPSQSEAETRVVRAPISSAPRQPVEGDPAAHWLLTNGLSLLEKGQLGQARGYLRRAADAGLSGAAIALAETYDPEILPRFHFVGVSPNRELAKQWYRRAQQLGAPEAEDRLRRLGD